MIIHLAALMLGIACFFTAAAYWKKGILDYLIAGIVWMSSAVGVVAIEIEVAGTTQNGIGLAWICALIAFVMFFQAIVLQFKPEKWGEGFRG